MFWSSPQTRFETHAEDQNAARKTLKIQRPLLFAGHLLKSGSVLVRAFMKRSKPPATALIRPQGY
jgi:uncharacterized membrane protein YgdD (TMEM256/DUF423 family)